MKPVDQISDQALLELLSNTGTSEEGISYLYKTQFERLGWFIMNNNGSRDDAEDIFQEVMISFVYMVQQKKFRGASSIGTFLYSMNKNLWFNELKRRERAGKRNMKFEALKNTTDEGQDRSIERNEASGQLLRLMEIIGENCRKILVLFYYENLPMKEIVEKMEYENEQVARNKKYKCLKKLQEMIHSEKHILQQLKNLLNG